MSLYEDDCSSELTQISLNDPHSGWQSLRLLPLLRYCVLRPNLELQTLKEMAVVEIAPCVQIVVCRAAPHVEPGKHTYPEALNTTSVWVVHPSSARNHSEKTGLLIVPNICTKIINLIIDWRENICNVQVVCTNVRSWESHGHHWLQRSAFTEPAQLQNYSYRFNLT